MSKPRARLTASDVNEMNSVDVQVRSRGKQCVMNSFVYHSRRADRNGLCVNVHARWFVCLSVLVVACSVAFLCGCVFVSRASCCPSCWREAAHAEFSLRETTW